MTPRGDRRSGRPLGFDRANALRAAVDLFWQQGYATTSLDDLLQRMGMARSSFYATFGSKHGILLEALELYTGELRERMARAVHSAATPRAALRELLRIAACSERPGQGCLFVNSATELCPRDDAVRRLAQAHLACVRGLFREALRQLGVSRAQASARADDLVALSIGAVTLRKAGESPRRVLAMLDRALTAAAHADAVAGVETRARRQTRVGRASP